MKKDIKNGKKFSIRFFPIGMAIGASLGVVFKNIPIALILGLCIGLFIDIISNKVRKNDHI